MELPDDEGHGLGIVQRARRDARPREPRPGRAVPVVERSRVGRQRALDRPGGRDRRALDHEIERPLDDGVREETARAARQRAGGALQEREAVLVIASHHGRAGSRGGEQVDAHAPPLPLASDAQRVR